MKNVVPFDSVSRPASTQMEREGFVLTVPQIRGLGCGFGPANHKTKKNLRVSPRPERTSVCRGPSGALTPLGRGPADGPEGAEGGRRKPTRRSERRAGGLRGARRVNLCAGFFIVFLPLRPSPEAEEGGGGRRGPTGVGHGL